MVQDRFVSGLRLGAAEAKPTHALSQSGRRNAFSCLCGVARLTCRKEPAMPIEKVTSQQATPKRDSSKSTILPHHLHSEVDYAAAIQQRWKARKVVELDALWRGGEALFDLKLGQKHRQTRPQRVQAGNEETA
jgi:hypothetical protein